MIELLTHIKAKLQTSITVAKKVEILPDIFLFPSEAGFPVVGVLLGAVTYKQFQMHRIEKILVTIVAYQQVITPEVSMLGDTTRDGILDILEDVETALKNECFTGHLTNVVNNVDIKGRSEPQVIVNMAEPQPVVYGTATLEYTRERLEVIP